MALLRMRRRRGAAGAAVERPPAGGGRQRAPAVEGPPAGGALRVLPPPRAGALALPLGLCAAAAALAALSGGAALGLASASSSLGLRLSGLYTLEVPTRAPGGGPPVLGQGDGAASPGEYEREVVALARALPGVASVEPVPEDEVRDLLGPWLDGGLGEGLGGGADAVALPRFHLVRVEGGALDAAAVESLLRVAPGVRLERPDAWNRPLLEAAGAMRAAALLALALAAAAFALASATAVRTALADESDSILLLRRLGADDRLLARALSSRAGAIGAAGAGIGAALAAPPLLLASGALGGGVVPPAAWALLPALPLPAWAAARLAGAAAARAALSRVP